MFISGRDYFRHNILHISYSYLYIWIADWYNVFTYSRSPAQEHAGLYQGEICFWRRIFKTAIWINIWVWFGFILSKYNLHITHLNVQISYSYIYTYCSLVPPISKHSSPKNCPLVPALLTHLLQHDLLFFVELFLCNGCLNAYNILLNLKVIS